MIHRDVRKVFEDITDGKVQTYLSARVASLQQVLDIFVLSDELLLHGSPHHLQQVLLLAQMLLHLPVELLQPGLDLAARVVGQHPPQLLLAELVLERDLGLLHAGVDLDAHPVKEDVHLHTGLELRWK